MKCNKNNTITILKSQVTNFRPTRWTSIKTSPTSDMSQYENDAGPNYVTLSTSACPVAWQGRMYGWSDGSRSWPGLTISRLTGCLI